MENVERKLQDVLSALGQRVGTERVAQVLGGAIVGAARTKATLERNMDALMAMANLPTRRDYQRVQAKLEALQGSIANLTRAVEELRETLSNGHAPAGRAKRTSSRRAKPSAASGRTGTAKRTRKR